MTDIASWKLYTCRNSSWDRLEKNSSSAIGSLAGIEPTPLRRLWNALR